MRNISGNEEFKMTNWLVELICNDRELLSFLVEDQQVPAYTFIRREGNYYLSSPDFDKLPTVEEVELHADGLLLYLNGLIKQQFMTNGDLTRTGTVVDITNLHHPITKVTKNSMGRVGVRLDFHEAASAQKPNFTEKKLIASKDE